MIVSRTTVSFGLSSVRVTGLFFWKRTACGTSHLEIIFQEKTTPRTDEDYTYEVCYASQNLSLAVLTVTGWVDWRGSPKCRPQVTRHSVARPPPPPAQLNTAQLLQNVTTERFLGKTTLIQNGPFLVSVAIS
jgi:hypothetical protein